MTHDDELKFSKSLTQLLPNAKAFAGSLLGHGRPYSSLYEDFAQDALMKAWQHRHRLMPDSNLKAWLFAVIRNTIVSHHRRHWREVITENAVNQHTQDDIANPEQAAIVKDVYRKFDLLPEIHRQALLEIAWAGLSYGEAAELRGIALGTMKSRVSRAREVLSTISGRNEFCDNREATRRRRATRGSRKMACGSGVVPCPVSPLSNVKSAS